VRADLSQVVIVDNSPVAYSRHADNAVPISTWTDDPADDALLGLLPLLAGLPLLNDVRSILSLRNAPPGQHPPSSSSSSSSSAVTQPDPDPLPCLPATPTLGLAEGGVGSAPVRTLRVRG